MSRCPGSSRSGAASTRPIAGSPRTRSTPRSAPRAKGAALGHGDPAPRRRARMPRRGIRRAVSRHRIEPALAAAVRARYGTEADAVLALGAERDSSVDSIRMPTTSRRRWPGRSSRSWRCRSTTSWPAGCDWPSRPATMARPWRHAWPPSWSRPGLGRRAPGRRGGDLHGRRGAGVRRSLSVPWVLAGAP